MRLKEYLDLQTQERRILIVSDAAKAELTAKAEEQIGQVAKGTYDDTRRVLPKLYFYADDGNFHKNIVRRQRSRRKARTCCLVCILPAYRYTCVRAFRQAGEISCGIRLIKCGKRT